MIPASKMLHLLICALYNKHDCHGGSFALAWKTSAANGMAVSCFASMWGTFLSSSAGLRCEASWH